MSTRVRDAGGGNRPASTRSQVRYNRRDRAVANPTDRADRSPAERPERTDRVERLDPVDRSDRVDRPKNRAPERTPDRTSDRATKRVPARTPGFSVPSTAPPAATNPAASSSEASIPGRARRGFLGWRRANRRVTVESHSPVLWIAEHVLLVLRRLLVVAKILAALVLLVAAVFGGRVAVQHVVASPRFSVREVRVGPTTHVDRDEIIQRTGVNVGDRLLALDTDTIAARLTRHPWIAAARVRRELPATLVVDVTERHAAAVAVVGGLYLIDDQGHPFKHATLAEADGQIVLTGISRAAYAGLPRASEAAFQEALALYAEYQHPDSLTAARPGARPPLSEIHIDPRVGFSLFLYDGGGEIRLGRGGLADKLARLDEILANLGPRGISALRVIHLDGPAGDRVPIRLAPPAAPPEPPPPPRSGR
jgi:cell division septal protein FtsQ